MLNEQQSAVVSSNADKILCLAGAGTGKTYCMISRIDRLVKDGVSPESILVLTFTNAAAFEMKERFRKINPSGIIPEFRTFHSFCYSLLIRDREVLKHMGYFKVPSIAEPNRAKTIEVEAIKYTGIKPTKNILTHNVTCMTQKEKFDHDIISKQTMKMMRGENVITFDYLCNGVCKMFVDDNPIIKKYKDQYKYVFVDEYQDTDPKQAEFVYSFKDSKLFVVGDALQSIYGFRDADSSIIKGLADNKDWEVHKLSENYRSTTQITNFANGMSDYADESYRVQIQGHGDGPAVNIDYQTTTYKNRVDKAVLDFVVAASEKNEGTTAILARSNAEVDEMIAKLIEAGITPRTGKKNEDAIHILQCCNDNEYACDWLSTFLNAQQYAEFIRLYTVNEETPKISILLKNFGTVRNIAIRLEKINKIRKLAKSHPSTLEFCTGALEALEIKDIVVDTALIKDTSFQSIVEYLIKEIEIEQSSDLYVGTVHSSKGLEYDNVILFGVNGRSFPLINEDNMNLYYVGITRAKKNLTIFMEERV